MTVADIFTALSEDRPYRKGMEKDEIIKTLNNLVTAGKIDREIVQILLNNYEEADILRRECQEAISKRFNNFKELFYSKT